MQYISEYIAFLTEEGKNPKTINAYKSSTNQFFMWLNDSIGETYITAIKPLTIKDFISFEKHQQKKSQASINRHIAALKSFFAFLADQGYISDNPMTRIKLQKIRHDVKTDGSVKWLNKAEQDKFIGYVDLERNVLKRIRNLAIIDLMLYAGFRVSEVSDLKLSDVKINGNIEITIREGKQGKYATVTLIERHSKNLRKWLKLRGTLEKQIYVDSEYIFVSERNGQFTARGIQFMIEYYGNLAQMDNISCHSFRHSFCKNLANAGVNIQTIRDLARHESIQTTLIYVENGREERLIALEMM